MPIDINWLRAEKGGDPEKWREHMRKRFKDASLIDKVIEIDQVSDSEQIVWCRGVLAPPRQILQLCTCGPLTIHGSNRASAAAMAKGTI